MFHFSEWETALHFLSFSCPLTRLRSRSHPQTYKCYQIKQRKVCQLWNYCSSGPLFLHPLRKVMDSRESKGWERKKSRWGRDLIPPCISLQPATLHLSAVAPSLGCVLLCCCGIWISVCMLQGRKWQEQCWIRTVFELDNGFSIIEPN